MEDSILVTVKKLLGITSEYQHFDVDIITHINAVFVILQQLGVGPAQGFSISGSEETWKDFISNQILFNDVKSYVYLKVRLLFDPPSNGSVVESLKNMISELECRMTYTADEINWLNNNTLVP